MFFSHTKHIPPNPSIPQSLQRWLCHISHSTDDFAIWPHPFRIKRQTLFTFHESRLLLESFHVNRTWWEWCCEILRLGLASSGTSAFHSWNVFHWGPAAMLWWSSSCHVEKLWWKSPSPQPLLYRASDPYPCQPCEDTLETSVTPALHMTPVRQNSSLVTQRIITYDKLLF